MMKTLFRVLTQDEFGMRYTQENNFKTIEEAQKEATECIQRRGQSGQHFWVESYKHEKHKAQRIYAHPNSIDGWEDIYPIH